MCLSMVRTLKSSEVSLTRRWGLQLENGSKNMLSHVTPSKSAAAQRLTHTNFAWSRCHLFASLIFPSTSSFPLQHRINTIISCDCCALKRCFLWIQYHIQRLDGVQLASASAQQDGRSIFVFVLGRRSSPSRLRSPSVRAHH